MQVQLEVVEQVEQVELHIHKGQQLIMALAGGAGGGGSGFVCTATARPSSGYYVDSKYNLTNATTYTGSSSFTSTSGGTETGHSGNGYAKITLVSGTTTKKVPANKIVTGTRWKGILETANFDYGDKIIRETDSKSNVLEHRKINAIEYIKSTGTQYIDTGCTINKTDSFAIEIEAQFPTESRADVYMGANGYGQLKISSVYSISSPTSKKVGDKDKVTITYLNTTETLAVNGVTVETKSWSSEYSGQNVKIRSI